ncbi:MAG TPA: TSUP family transporter, partial [Phenylobacterium sp.]|nr:TSUP family transporter [Phenylobacterium sp.]
LMGMDPRLIFPIMACGGALAVAGAGVSHIARGEVDLRIGLGLALGGIPAVLIAALLVKGMPIDLLRWLVTAVVLYAAFAMLRSAATREAPPLGAGAG